MRHSTYLKYKDHFEAYEKSAQSMYSYCLEHDLCQPAFWRVYKAWKKGDIDPKPVKKEAVYTGKPVTFVRVVIE